MFVISPSDSVNAGDTKLLRRRETDSGWDIYFKDENYIELNSRHVTYLVFGNIDYILSDDTAVTSSEKKFHSLLNYYLEKNFLEGELKQIEGRFAIIGIFKKEISIRSDCFGKKEVFYSRQHNVAGSEITANFGGEAKLSFDYSTLGLSLSVHGNYGHKSRSIYKEISRLDVGEILTFAKSEMKLTKIVHEKKRIRQYEDLNLDDYFNFIVETIKLSASDQENYVFMSSGWDSSAILSILSHVGIKANPIIARFKYSNKSGINNKFEVERAKAICDYFDTPLIVLDIDYTHKSYNDDWERYLPYFKANHLYSLFPFNFFKMSEYIKKRSGDGNVIFNGETSDGAHNFGFSQFATILEHPDLSFREYSDKMHCYLYGPTFFKSIENDEFSSDFVYKSLSARSCLNRYTISKNWKFDYALSFFFGSARIPFAPPSYNSFLSKIGSKKVEEFLLTTLNEFCLNATAENIYSWWLFLYNSFHWQGGTVRGLQIAPEIFGQNVKAPFWDIRVQDFLSVMPEKFGRGLDLNTVKYPLKTVLSEKINYPIGLQKGPHSYLYDIDPNWSADADILYGSSRVSHFKTLFNSQLFCDLVDSGYIEKDYVKGISNKYKEGIELKGTELIDIKNIISVLNVGTI